MAAGSGGAPAQTQQGANIPPQHPQQQQGANIQQQHQAGNNNAGGKSWSSVTMGGKKPGGMLKSVISVIINTVTIVINASP